MINFLILYKKAAANHSYDSFLVTVQTLLTVTNDTQIRSRLGKTGVALACFTHSFHTTQQGLVRTELLHFHLYIILLLLQDKLLAVLLQLYLLLSVYEVHLLMLYRCQCRFPSLLFPVILQ